MRGGLDLNVTGATLNFDRLRNRSKDEIGVVICVQRIRFGATEKWNADCCRGEAVYL